MLAPGISALLGRTQLAGSVRVLLSDALQPNLRTDRTRAAAQSRVDKKGLKVYGRSACLRRRKPAPSCVEAWPDLWSRGRHRGPSYGWATILFAKRHVRGHFYGSAVLRQLNHARPRIRTALTAPKMAVLAPVRTIVSTVAGVKPGDFRRVRTAYPRSPRSLASLETRKGSGS
jgi:hypothetical protein